MKLVSIDVGIRNLAFCVMEGTNRTNVQIVHWDLIDVMAEGAGHDSPKCFKCLKPANWLNGKKVYACTLHKSKSPKPPTKVSLNKKTLDELKKEGEPFGIHSTTKKGYVDILYTHYNLNVWKRCIKSSKQCSVVDLSIPIAASLESRRSLWEGSDLVALEQQPDKRMLCIQSMIHMWFVCNKFKCTGVSATHKLTNILTTDPTKTYKDRKKTGIIHATQLVPPQWKAHMLKHPKKDDLCDTFLQGLWVMEHTK
uniref:Mitochondrial resolvase Ydc2 catalytic domain-containing protein n=1 Tax=viral metagenome TaxID=1070528 RepID=A0A6C0AI11_9ZZZZ